jgi:tRNA threonylcarbamoyladenosine biosynthesis protein TsaE
VARATVSRSEAETAAVGESLAGRLRGGEVVLLFGDLGAGKTAFVRGMARGLGIDPADIVSPTFTLVQPHRGRLTLQHVDLYRLADDEVADLALDELCADDVVLAVEWAERWLDAPETAIAVKLTADGGDVRQIVVETPSLPSR